ncbi:hypothetical protein PR048_029170 [Dryococelus australis]|uniref:Uncharacterized protein n=1 Tax=Dryococelus australis TaxID=614101 RepID=A0ABQ9GCM4_9NEOP|nr:hypothetical protein PR048_029170 [Dryococelus australis]
MKGKRGEYGAAPECRGWGNWRFPRIPAVQLHRPARIPTCENPAVIQPGIEPGFPEHDQVQVIHWIDTTNIPHPLDRLNTMIGRLDRELRLFLVKRRFGARPRGALRRPPPAGDHVGERPGSVGSLPQWKAGVIVWFGGKCSTTARTMTKYQYTKCACFWEYLIPVTRLWGVLTAVDLNDAKYPQTRLDSSHAFESSIPRLIGSPVFFAIPLCRAEHAKPTVITHRPLPLFLLSSLKGDSDFFL